MNETAVAIILSITATSTIALWGFVMGMYHRLKVTIWREEKTDDPR